MTRLMSVSHTEGAVRGGLKDVTRRLGWRFLKPGDRVTLCRKVMGRKPGEPIDRIRDVEIVAVRRERLCAMQPSDVAREAAWESADYWGRWATPDHDGCPLVPETMVAAWVAWFAATFRIGPHDEITRIEWRFL